MGSEVSQEQGVVVVASIKPGRPEYKFWKKVIGLLINKKKLTDDNMDTFESEAEKNPYTADWNKIFKGFREFSGSSKFARYINLLKEIVSIIKKWLDDSDIPDLKKKAHAVVEYRARVAKDDNHKRVLKLWENIESGL